MRKIMIFCKKYVRFCCFLAGLSLLSCAASEHKKYYPHDRLGEYQQGTTLPVLKAPPGMTVVQPDPYYQIPHVNTTSLMINILPPGSALLQQAQEKQKKS
jgi:uncharacterized lipoprotein